MKIFVTGATGFIGSHLVRRLSRDKHKVTAYVRPNSSFKYIAKEKIDICYGDILNSRQLEEALSGFDAVYHNAALVSDWGNKEAFYRTNVQGTKNVLAAMHKNKIKSLILTSTAGVLGEEDCLAAKDENSPYKPKTNYFLSGLFDCGLNYYRESKMMAEKEAIEFCEEKGICLTVIRPVWVYGPREFDSGPFSFCQAVLNGLPFAPVGKNNFFHVVYVGDLVQAMSLVLEKNLKGINIFIIGNTRPPLARDYLSLFCKMLGRDMPMRLPEIFFQAFGFMLELIYKLCRIKRSPVLNRSRAHMFYCNNIYDVSRAENELGFTPSTSLESGIKKTVRWWRQNGFF